jgi:hypothetical protein
LNYIFGEAKVASQMYAYIKPCEWISSRGTKGIVWSHALNGYLYLHIRYYGCYGEPLYIASTHYDQYPLESWSGYSTFATIDATHLAMLKGLDVVRDYVNLLNAEGFWIDENKARLHNGFASIVKNTFR